MRVHPRTKARLKTKLKELTSRSNGWGYEKRKEKLTYAIRGWVNYFRLAEMGIFLKETDEWLRSRIRMCIWKCWKRGPNKKNKTLNLYDLALYYVALEGFEPSQAEPESDVLPLHHKAIYLLQRNLRLASA